MYVSTFYSFKGGVGRSLALVNVACELAKRGRKVLLVDLDLEAPGLETFPCLKCADSKPGIVDYIHQYINTGVSPDVRDFINSCTFKDSKDSGALWLMTAGQTAERYGDLFTKIDWQMLYEHQEGYLMFEDLKLQWREIIQPDYVLIDSRTGHTDVGGICTRQLPDSVFILFFPNEQNIRGLTKVANDIRSEKRNVKLNFVLANVPDLDDDLEILERQLNRAQSALGYDELSATIHHYDSMLLLDQDAFVLSRPKTKLAWEYRQLTDSLMRDNINDPDGVKGYLAQAQDQFMLDFLSRGNPHARKSEVIMNRVSFFSDTREKAARIRELYNEAPDVLMSLATFYDHTNQYDDCLNTLRRLSALTKPPPHAIYQMAMLARLTEGAAASLPYIDQLFSDPNADFGEILQCVVWAREISPSSLKTLVRSEGFLNAPIGQRCRLLDATIWEGCDSSTEIALTDILERCDPSTIGQSYLSILSLSAIALRQFQKALDLLDLESPTIARDFNRAIANWGHMRSPSKSLFAKVILTHQQSSPKDIRRNTSNYWMCIAIAYGATQDISEAKSALQMSHDIMRASQISEFSGWRFRYVSPGDFLRDIDDIKMAILRDTPITPPAVALPPYQLIDPN
jgi:MinD-like ATPase involved in chromosome partitioning or flagellar assembly